MHFVSPTTKREKIDGNCYDVGAMVKIEAKFDRKIGTEASFGYVITNVNRTQIKNSTTGIKEYLPNTEKMGGALRLGLRNNCSRRMFLWGNTLHSCEVVALTGLMDVVKVTRQAEPYQTIHSFGGEFTIFNIIFARGGWGESHQSQTETHYTTLGGGVRIPMFRGTDGVFNYAVERYPDQSDRRIWDANISMRF